MGRMIDGEWTTEWYEPDEEGRFVRPETSFRGRVEASSEATHPAAAGRYHLYVSYACPWAHRVLLARKLRGLEDVISVSVVDWFMGEDGWRFRPDVPGATEDHLHGKDFLREVYREAAADYTGRVTVPVLWDREAGSIVNNESREIVGMLDDAFDGLAVRDEKLIPEVLRPEVDRVADAIYQPINNGVYRAGFATSQAAYDEAVGELFAALEHWDGVLGASRFVTGSRLTAADLFLFTTLVRFDPVYHTHFKCNVRRVEDFPNLSGFVRDVYQAPGVADTVRLDHIKNHYYRSHPDVNPHGIVPAGDGMDLAAPHDRDRFGAAQPGSYFGG